MKNKLDNKTYKTFSSYIEFVKSLLSKENFRQRQLATKEGIRIVHLNSDYWIRSTVDYLEDSQEFQNLRKDSKIPTYNLKNFFRRSKLYLEIFESSLKDVDSYFDILSSAFDKRQVKTTKLRLIESVDFDKPTIDFGTFSIQKFSKRQLDELVQNQSNRIFYHNAELDTSKLEDFWFIVEEQTIIKEMLNPSLLTIDTGDYIVSGDLPDRVVQLLALFDWENFETSSDKIENDPGWFPFSLPILIEVNDDVFKSPRNSPNLSGLMFEPYFDNYGEEVGERPFFFISMLKWEIDKFESVVKRYKDFINSIDLRECNWDFLDIAMGYLAKALLTKDYMEQLLWHITVLEALLNEDNEKDGITNNIKRRLGLIFGENDQKKIESIRKSFGDLYDFRSKLVHGKSMKRSVYQGHLKEARKLAREMLCWFIDSLAPIHSQLTKKGISANKYPKHDKILFAIDFKLKTIKCDYGEIEFRVN